MKNSRSIRSRGKRRFKKGVVDLDITSLLDILVILLVFLLRSYDSSGIVTNIPKDITLPKSESSTIKSTGVMVQVSQDKIWVEDKEIFSRQSPEGKSYDHNGKRILPLYNELVKIKKKIKRVEKSAPNAEKFSAVVNLVVDKSIKYNYIKKLLYTCAEAGFRKYKFVVLAQE